MKGTILWYEPGEEGIGCIVDNVGDKYFFEKIDVVDKGIRIRANDNVQFDKDDVDLAKNISRIFP